MSPDGTARDDHPDNPPQWLEAYRGLTAEECRELAQRQQRPIRVIGADSVVTAEFVAQRLTVQVGQAGQVVDIYHG
jgi:hypothetical protein